MAPPALIVPGIEFEPRAARLSRALKRLSFTFFIVRLGFAPGLAAEAPIAEIVVNFSRANGVLRPLHGGNSGPLNYGGLIDLTAAHRELGIPFTRLHDCHWPNPDVVDIHALFPDFTQDPERPENYDFERTDDYLRAIRDAGSQVIFRLGESIEHTPKKYRVHPPKDFEKWAAICLGIIRHYNEGWAGGFQWDIRYWEIWNEPDVRPLMWTGTDEAFIRLFSTAAKTIKARFPNLKVGGPAFGTVGEWRGDSLNPTPFAAKFFEHCRRENVPLDFFSWHTYGPDPALPARLARAVRRMLDGYGFSRCESHLNEWNYLPENDWSPLSLPNQGLKRERFFARIGGAEGAAYAACVLLNLQDAPVDVANYFSAEIQGFGLFTFDGVPKKTFYAFKAFQSLRATPRRVAVQGGDTSKLVAAAGLAVDGKRAAVLVSNFQGDAASVRLRLDALPWKGETRYRVLLVDAQHDLQEIRSGTLNRDTTQRREAATEAFGVRREVKRNAAWVTFASVSKAVSPACRAAGRPLRSATALQDRRASRQFRPIQIELTQPLPAPGVCLVELQPMANR